MSDKVRVLRILEYVGDREWIEDVLKQSSIPNDGAKEFSSREHPEYKNIIKSAIIDEFPEILNRE